MARVSDIPEQYRDANSKIEFLGYLADLEVDIQIKTELLSLFSKEFDVTFNAAEVRSIGIGDQSD